MNNRDNWLSMIDATEHTAFSSRTIQRAMAKGEIRFIKVGRNIRFKKIWLDAWIMGFGSRLTASQKLILKNIREGSE